ncbi:MAG: sulfotransferase [Pseudomonadota bacterium]
MTDRGLIFCAGATKAGTSWLFRALKDHPETHFRSIKELHYFDALDKDRVPDQIARQERLRAAQAERLASGTGDREDLMRKIADRDAYLSVLALGEDTDAYIAYLTDGAQGRLVGDFTPAYGLLSVERLGKMARLMANVAFVYLLRDPIERLWSQIRQVSAMRESDGTVTRARADRIFERTLKGKEGEITSRSDYEGAVTRLSKAAGDKLHVVVTEDVTQEAGFHRLCQALGLSRHAPLGDTINEGQGLEMTKEQRARAREWLQPQYDFVARHLGALPAAWNEPMIRV